MEISQTYVSVTQNKVRKYIYISQQQVLKKGGSFEKKKELKRNSYILQLIRLIRNKFVA